MPLKIEVIHSTCYTLALRTRKDAPLLYLTKLVNITNPTGTATPWLCKDIVKDIFGHSIFVFSCLAGEKTSKSVLPLQPRERRKSKRLHYTEAIAAPALLDPVLSIVS